MSRPSPRAVAALAATAVLLAPPFYLDAFWLQTGLFAMSAAIGAIGLNLLTGATGQLSMGHAFFLAVGAYGYVYLASGPEPRLAGLGLPTPLAFAAPSSWPASRAACSAPSPRGCAAPTSASRPSR